jgi:exopolyphosphatase / guanosine-5'-triphosphate,3'-diphosphate pyrophosphatase
MTTLASIDIGTYTARLLVARVLDSTRKLQPLERKRAYIRTGDGFRHATDEIIKKEAFERTLAVLKDFLVTIKKHEADRVRAVATGVIREAVNGEDLVRYIEKNSGLNVKIIQGLEEAVLTAKGVATSTGLEGPDNIIFDLGGGSTEFVLGHIKRPILKSVPLGAFTLTQNFLASDPPIRERLDALSSFVENLLKISFRGMEIVSGKKKLIGTGGSVVALGAMCHEIPLEEITAERVNGLNVKYGSAKDLFDNIRALPMDERLKIKGLDRGRAGVILAGTLAIIRIMSFFKTQYLTVSMSDILEGLLIDCLEGETKYG